MGQQVDIGNAAVVPAVLGEALTMSSREIADVCETRHNQVVETIERLMETGVLRDSRKTTRRVQPNGGGRPINVYDLTKRDSLVVVSGYKDEVRARIIDRWIELENARVPQSIGDWARIAIAQEERFQALQLESQQKDAAIGAMKPAADAYDAYLSEEGVCRIMDFCNKHGVKKNHPGYVLRDRGLMHQKKVLATQTGLKSGILKNVLEKNGFEYIDSKGQSVESQLAMIVRQREVSLLKMIVDAYGMTAFRNPVAFERAKNLIGGAA
ncbi:Rha family transcriptional regulator [Sulfitobacter sp. 1A13679]|uniref:Rha family transcriptional regulator n=1 Tax=Sulfitobacter sp. 1A13679 TaxID=3368597 RepID=UPI003746AC8A